MPSGLAQKVSRLLAPLHRWTEAAAGLLSRLLVPVLRRRMVPGSVLHVSYMVHIPFYTVALLRQHGVRADYLAIGRSGHWNKADFTYRQSRIPGLRALQQLWLFWTLIARYEVIHAHFLYGISQSGWEFGILNRLGRRLIVHFRGCEARDRTLNMALHPALNICQECDYSPTICELPASVLKRRLARSHADQILVTTPDMRDFFPEAVHFPFFAPLDELLPAPTDRLWPERETFHIIHVTTHPGIEGTRHIEAAVEALVRKGRPIRWTFLRDVSHDQVLAALADADLCIGKMKMGYYANAQIEAMACGIPTVTFVRPEFMTDALRQSGFIFADLGDLETIIEYYLDHPDALLAKRRIAHASILALHDNRALVEQLVELYRAMPVVGVAA